MASVPSPRVAYLSLLVVALGCGADAEPLVPADKLCATFLRDAATSDSLGFDVFEARYFAYNARGELIRRDVDSNVSSSVDRYEIFSYANGVVRTRALWSGVPKPAPPAPSPSPSSAVFRPPQFADDYDEYLQVLQETYEHDAEGQLIRAEADLAGYQPGLNPDGTGATPSGSLDGVVDSRSEYTYADGRLQTVSVYGQSGTLERSTMIVYEVEGGRIITRQTHQTLSGGIESVVVESYTYNPDGNASDVMRQLSSGINGVPLEYSCTLHNTYNGDATLASRQGCGQHEVHVYGQHCQEPDVMALALQQLGLEPTPETATSERPRAQSVAGAQL
jgi:hypothetical protein